MGAGKTATVINIIRHHFNRARHNLRTLILCPPIVIKNWKKEFLEHSKIEPSQICLLQGSGHQRKEKFLDAPCGERPSIFITNYESL